MNCTTVILTHIELILADSPLLDIYVRRRVKGTVLICHTDQTHKLHAIEISRTMDTIHATQPLLTRETPTATD